MKKSIIRIAAFSLLAAALAVPSSQAFGQEVKKESKPKKEKAADETTEKAPNKQGFIPFHGKIDAVDKTAKTIKVGTRTLHVTPETKIKKGGQPTTLNVATVGEEVGGNYKKADDGKLLLQSLRIGPKPEVPAEAKKQTNTERMKEGIKKDTKSVNAQ